MTGTGKWKYRKWKYRKYGMSLKNMELQLEKWNGIEIDVIKNICNDNISATSLKQIRKKR